MSVLHIFFLVTLLVYLLMHVWRSRRSFYLGYYLPGPSYLVNIRQSLHLLGPMETVTQNLIKYYRGETNNPHQPLYKFWYLSKLLVILTDPTLVRRTCQGQLIKDTALYGLMDSFFNGQGLLHSIVPKWKAHRRFIESTSFKVTALKTYTDIMFEESNHLADKMKPMAESGQAFEPVHMLTLTSYQIVLRTVCGLDMRIQQTHHDAHPFTSAAEEAFQMPTLRLSKPWLLIDVIFGLCGYKSREAEISALARDTAEDIIARTRAKIEQEKTTTREDFKDDTSRPLRTYVETILRDQMDPDIPAQHVMSHRDLVAEVITLISVGFDTTKTANAILLNMLAIHPGLQQQVYEELKSVLGDDPLVPPTYDQLQDLPLLDRVIKETLRLYPIAPIIARKAEQDIQAGGCTIPKGTLLAIFIYGIHRDPRYWPKPDQFDPDRFLPSESDCRHPDAYLPFSVGTRNCIGNKYAMLQMKIIATTLLRRYRVLPGERCKSVGDIRFEFGLTMRLLEGNDIRLEPRVPPRRSRLDKPQRHA